MYTLNCKGKLLIIDQPVVMGIINITPDSFYSGSRRQATADIVTVAGTMLREGAAMIDLGGQSTRPGSSLVSESEEKSRVIPAIEAIYRQFPHCVISVDTFYATVAEAAVKAGASIVNDISAGLFDTNMLSMVASLDVPYVCMHNKGIGDGMHKDPHYEDIVKEVLDFFIERIAACQNAGIKDVVIDPGFGFAKTIAHNFQLLQRLPVFKMLEKPLLLGVSRKSTIYKTLGITADEALNGSTVLHTIGLLNGAAILRAHDVKEAMEAIKLVSAYQTI